MTPDQRAAQKADEAARARKWASHAADNGACKHHRVTSTNERGWHCVDCGTGLLSLTCPIPLQTIAEALFAIGKGRTT